MAVDQLSKTLSALADPTRRAILARLSPGEDGRSPTRLAVRDEPAAVSKHLKVLERAGLITRGREAQWRPARLDAQRLRQVAGFLDGYRRFWEESFERLDDVLREVQEEQATTSRAPQDATASEGGGA